MSKVILVTGGSGLIGKNIEEVVNSIEGTQDRYIFLSSKEGDLRDVEVCKRIFEVNKPSHVIHLAAKVGGLYANMKEPVTFLEDNLAINRNILLCAHQYEVQKVISCLSTCIFPDKTSYPIDETMIHNGPPHESNFGYAYAKRLLDTQNKAYHNQFGKLFTSVIPTNIFGKHDNFNLGDSHVIPALIHKCYLAKLKNEPLLIKGSGKPLRQFIYAKDLAKLFIWAVDNYNSVEPIIFSVGEEDEISIKDVVSTIVEAMEFKNEVIYDTKFADGQFKKTASNKKLLELWNNELQFTPFQQAIKESVDWFVECYENVRK